MATSNSTARQKPAKPSLDFPLFAHATGQWAKKIAGRMRYFGRWENPAEALERFHLQKDDLYAGRVPRSYAVHSVRVKDVCNEFLTAKETLVDTGELSRRHFKDLRWATDTIVDHFGGNRQAEDILSAEFAELRRKLAKRYGPAGLTRTIANVRQVFNFAKANHLIEDVHFGSEFKGPSRKVKRLHAAKNGVKLFEPQEVLDLLESASPSMRAIILLGVNCGLGNADVATLQRRYVDLDSGWISYHRPKTGVYRRAKLWPETVDAIRNYLAIRRKPRQQMHRDLVFTTVRGGPWSNPDSADCAIAKAFRRLTTTARVYRPGATFYTLRRTFRTIADRSKDQPACDVAMGHETAGMAAIYRQRIDDDRLEAVANIVHEWLYAGTFR